MYVNEITSKINICLTLLNSQLSTREQPPKCSAIIFNCVVFRFKDVQQQGSTDAFSFSPCGGFSEGTCQDAAVRTFSLVQPAPCGLRGNWGQTFLHLFFTRNRHVFAYHNTSLQYHIHFPKQRKQVHSKFEQVYPFEHQQCQ